MTYFNPAQEELEAEFWGHYDYVKEAYGAEARAINESVRIEMQCAFEEDCIAAQDEIEARGGPRFYVAPDYDDIPF